MATADLRGREFNLRCGPSGPVTVRVDAGEDLSGYDPQLWVQPLTLAGPDSDEAFVVATRDDTDIATGVVEFTFDDVSDVPSGDYRLLMVDGDTVWTSGLFSRSMHPTSSQTVEVQVVLATVELSLELTVGPGGTGGGTTMPSGTAGQVPQLDTDGESYVVRTPNAANGLVRLDGSALIPEVLIPGSIARDSELEDLSGVTDAAEARSNLELGTAATKDVGSVNGVAELDSGGKVPSSQLPSYVDDVVEVANFAALPGTGEAGKIYVTLDTNLTYRWSGSAYVEISASLALGETSSTAYRGDRGKTAYDHSQVVTGNPHGTTAADIGAVDAEGDATVLWLGTESEYAAIGSPSASTVYVVVPDP